MTGARQPETAQEAEKKTNQTRAHARTQGASFFTTQKKHETTRPHSIFSLSARPADKTVNTPHTHTRANTRARMHPTCNGSHTVPFTDQRFCAGRARPSLCPSNDATARPSKKKKQKREENRTSFKQSKPQKKQRTQRAATETRKEKKKKKK